MKENAAYKTIVAVIAGGATTLLSGAVLASMWGWFLVPTLNVQPLTYLSAIGVQIVIGFLLWPVIMAIATKDDDSFKALGPLQKAIVRTCLFLLVWLIAWLWAVVLGVA